MAIGVFCNEGDNFDEMIKMALEEVERQAIEDSINETIAEAIEEDERCTEKGYDN